MGLFGKKEDCPVCGSEVKGLFLSNIANKKTLCKDCSKAWSMPKDMVKTATPEFMKEHIAYRAANAEKFVATAWDAKYSAIGVAIGVNLAEKLVYIKCDNMHNEDNPSIFSFDEITAYSFYKFKKMLDDHNDPGETALETTMGVVGAVAGLLSGKDSNDVINYWLKLETTNKYWPSIELKLSATDNQMFGFGGASKEMSVICQVFKRIVRKETIELPTV